MRTQTKTRWMLRGAISAAMLGFTPLAANAVPITGMPVPQLANFDALMSDFMDDNGIEAGLLGIMKDGVIVYQRGFGWKDKDHNELLRHDALMRIASCTKPITAAAVQRLIAANFLDPNDFVFDLGQPGGGILNINPFGALIDNQYSQVRLMQLLTHRSGLRDNSAGDPTYNEVQIADDMGIYGVPGRLNTMRWIMGNTPLQSAPGAQRNYSNVGFLAAGMVVEQASGTSHINYVRQNVFGPMAWMPVTEVVAGRTFKANRDPREPWYDSDKMVVNVFDPDGKAVREPEGGWDHESRIGQGAYVVSTTAMLNLAEMYYISDKQSSDPTYGTLVNGSREYRWHNGSMPGGTMSMLVQRSDGINYAVIFDKKGNDVDSGQGYHFAIQALMDAEITGGGFTWPTQGVEGQWTDFAAGAGEGSFEEPWNDVSTAMADCQDETTVNFKPGSSDWTGTINQRVRIRAPLGTVTIGQ